VTRVPKAAATELFAPLAGPTLTVTQRAFLIRLKERHLPCPEAEYLFHPTRRWRFDWAWPEQRVALETEGGAWTGGRHTRGGGFIADMEKYSEAAALGWRILRVQPKVLANYPTVDLIARTLAYAP
jgi:hypothetical protein